MAVLAGMIPEEFEIAFYDDRIEDILYDEPTDLVCISALTFTAKRAYQISSEFRKRKIKVILGGFHPTFMTDEAIEYADSVALGESDVPILKLPL